MARLEAFEKYDTFAQVTNRAELARGEDPVPTTQHSTVITQKDVKPIGIYELNARKSDYVKTAFWTL